MKFNKDRLLALAPSISGFGDTREGVGLEFADYRNSYSVKKKSILEKRHKILYADYTHEGYEGSAYVFGYDTKAEKFFEVFGGHCSCYGLEGQWDEEYFKSMSVLSKVLTDRFSNRSEDWSRPSDSKEFETWINGGVLPRSIVI